MIFGLSNRAQLEKIPGGHWIVDTLNKMITAITDGYHTQHNTDDTHGAVTATSVFANTSGPLAGGGGAFTQAGGYVTPTAIRWIFGDGSNWKAVWSRWSTTTAATARNTAATNVTDVMTLTDNGVLSPVSLSGPSGIVGLTTTAPGPGGGATGTVATVGGTGPTNTASGGWVKVTLNGTTAYLPYWT